MSNSTPVYFDCNATTPLGKEVKLSISEALDVWGNPSSTYRIGKNAKCFIEEARKHVATMIEAPPEDIIFMSGGTEANNSVIYSVITNFYNQNVKDSGKIPHIITSPIEHYSIIKPLQYYESNEKISLSYLPLKNGKIIPDSLIPLLTPETCLVTVMLANNETGIIQPIFQLSSLLKTQKIAKNVILHTDAAQALGKIPVSAKDLNVDALTIVGHKFYGPRIGALYYRNAMLKDDKNNNQNVFQPFILGGGQERGLRSGTENVPMIAGLGEACHQVHKNINKMNYKNQLLKLATHFIDYLCKLCNEHNVRVNFNNLEIVSDKANHTDKERGDNGLHKRVSETFIKLVEEGQILPNTLNISFPDLSPYIMSGNEILKRCKFVCASTGAACHSILDEDKMITDDKIGGDKCPYVSSILTKSGLQSELAQRAIRISLGWYTTTDEIERGVNDLVDAIKSIIYDHKINLIDNVK